jgi:cytochrome oxidase assembly protein ShyY1
LPIRIRFQQVLILLLGLALAAAMVLLGIWQLRVYTAQGATAAQQRVAAPPVPLRSVASAGRAITDGYGRTVTVDGQYDPALQVLVPVGDRGPYRVLTALRQDDGSVVAVVRGLVDTGPAPAPPSGAVHQTGVLLPSEGAEPGAPVAAGQPSTVGLPLLAQQWPGPLINGFVTLSIDDAQAQQLVPATVTLPEARGRLRNGAYAIQWWLFAAFTLVMAVRMARDFGSREVGEPAEDVSEITTEPPANPA